MNRDARRSIIKTDEFNQSHTQERNLFNKSLHGVVSTLSAPLSGDKTKESRKANNDRKAEMENNKSDLLAFKANLLRDIADITKVLGKIAVGKFDIEIPQMRLVDMDTLRLGILDMARQFRECDGRDKKPIERIREDEQKRVAKEVLYNGGETVRIANKGRDVSCHAAELDIDCECISRHLQDNYKVDPSRVGEIMESARQTLRDKLGQCETALGQNDFDQVAYLAHSIKSTLGLLRLDKLALLAERLEKQKIRAGDELGPALRQQYCNLNEKLASFIGNPLIGNPLIGNPALHP